MRQHDGQRRSLAKVANRSDIDAGGSHREKSGCSCPARGGRRQRGRPLSNDFFGDGRAVVDATQPHTTVWFAYRLGPNTYGAVASFANDEDRRALLSAGGPRSARDNADLFVVPPTFEQVDLVAARQMARPARGRVRKLRRGPWAFRDRPTGRAPGLPSAGRRAVKGITRTCAGSNPPVGVLL